MVRAIFDHVLKTGGTSIRAAICGAHGRDFKMPAVGASHHKIMTHAHAQDFLSWHLWYLPGEPLAQGWHYATLLREPIDRFLSQYYFHRSHLKQVQDGSIIDPGVMQATRCSLEEYVFSDSKILRRSFVNLQAVHFAWRVCADPESLSDKDLLDAAIASLDQYDLVGVFSDMQEFLDAYCDALCLPRQNLPRLNVTPERKKTPELLPAVMRILLDSNVVDSALYSWAGQRFARQRANRSFAGVARAARRAHDASSPSASCVDFGSKSIRIDVARCRSASGASAVVAGGERISIELICAADVTEADLTLGIALHDAEGAFVYGTNTRQLEISLAVEKNRLYDLVLNLDAPAKSGRYHVTLALHRGESHLDGCYHWLADTFAFSVRGVAPTVVAEPIGPTAMPTVEIRRRVTETNSAIALAETTHADAAQRRYARAVRGLMQRLARRIVSRSAGYWSR